MAAPSTWPPPPNTPDPLAAHDGFLTSCVLNLSDKRPVSRLSLAGELRKERGIDARQCRAIVNDYCDRHAILPQARGVAAWGVSLILLLCAAYAVVLVSAFHFLRRSHDPAATPTMMAALENEAINIALVSMSVAIAVALALVITILRTAKKQRRDAEDARKKLAA